MFANHKNERVIGTRAARLIPIVEFDDLGLDDTFLFDVWVLAHFLVSLLILHMEQMK
jgi:hypothetical protein